MRPDISTGPIFFLFIHFGLAHFSPVCDIEQLWLLPQQLSEILAPREHQVRTRPALPFWFTYIV